MEKKFATLVKIIENCILIILGIIFILLFILLIEKYVFKVKYPSFNNKTVFVVKTESMSPTLLTNDIVVVDKKDKDFKVGDIVSYEDKDYVITHRIIQIDNEKIILKGDANNSADPAIDQSRIVGKVVKTLPNLRIWKMVLLDLKVDICILVTLCLFLTIKIVTIIEEKMDGKEEKIFKN